MGLEQATPAPWTYNEGNPTRIIGPDDETVAVLYGGTGGIDRQFANATLVAAAPVLYIYVAGRASSGDGEAKRIIDSLEGDGVPACSWRYEGVNPRRIIDAESTTIASVFGGMRDDGVQLANARLIGAVPVMRDFVRSRSEAGDDAATGLLQSVDPTRQAHA